MIKAVKFVAIPCRNQDVSLAFYTEKLGFRVVTDQPFNDEQRWIELGVGKSETKVVLFTAEAHRDLIGKQSTVTFVADDVEKTYRELLGRGVVFDQPAEKSDWGSAAIFRDPDGNQFVLSSK